MPFQLIIHKYTITILKNTLTIHIICYLILPRLLYSHLQRHNDKDAGRKTHDKDAGRTSLELYSSHFIARVWKGCLRVSCERMLETERKLHILTPLLWPSRCVFLVLLMLGSTPSGLSEGPLGRVWPSLPHLVSKPLGVCWQLLRGFSVCPLGRVCLSLPHLVSTVWNSTDNCSGDFPSAPSVGCGLPYHIVSNPQGVCWQLHRGFSECPPRSGVAFPTTSGLFCLEFYWQLPWDPNSTELNNNSTPTRSPTGSLKSNV